MMNLAHLHRFLSSLVVVCLMMAVQIAHANFNFCGSASGGNGVFQKQLASKDVVDIGVVPVGVVGLTIRLESDNDLDVQLFDDQNGFAIVKWPDGLMNAAATQSASYRGMQVSWSGFNGDQTVGGRGREWITVDSVKTPLNMKAFGFVAGYATVRYSWTGGSVANCSATSIASAGKGTFNQNVARNAISNVGPIPRGVANLAVSLVSTTDIDVQLYDTENGTEIVAWPNGRLNGADTQSISYEGMRITYSGFNGDGTGVGKEYIRIEGETKRNLQMRVFGYEQGVAQVTYDWDSSPARKAFFLYLSQVQRGDIMLFSGCPDGTPPNECASSGTKINIDVPYGFYRHAALIEGVSHNAVRVVHSHPSDYGVAAVAYDMKRFKDTGNYLWQLTAVRPSVTADQRRAAFSWIYARLGTNYSPYPGASGFSCSELIHEAFKSTGASLVPWDPVITPDDLFYSQLTIPVASVRMDMR